MARLRIGDVVEINGQRAVVWAKTFHWCCGVQCRIAYLNHLEYGDMVISGRGNPVGHDLAAAATALRAKTWECFGDAKRSRSARTKEIHRKRATKWERRWWKVKGLADKAVVVGGGE